MYYGLYVFKYHIFSVYTYVHISMCVYIYGTPQKKPMQTSILLVFTVNFYIF